MKKVKPKKCCVCGNEFTPRFKTTEKHCSYKCANSDKKPQKPKKSIPKFSRKRAKQENVYKKERRLFLEQPENQICFIGGCGKSSTTIEHRKGRIGYADDWAMENNITLLLDKRFWAGCCHEHNLELERNPELSRKYQLSKLHSGKKIEK